MTVTESYDYHDGWYEQRLHEPLRRRIKSYTAYCSMPNTPRGDYDEEIDVRALGPAPARRIVVAVLAEDYEAGMTVRRLVARAKGVWFL